MMENDYDSISESRRENLEKLDTYHSHRDDRQRFKSMITQAGSICSGQTGSSPSSSIRKASPLNSMPAESFPNGNVQGRSIPISSMSLGTKISRSTPTGVLPVGGLTQKKSSPRTSMTKSVATNKEIPLTIPESSPPGKASAEICDNMNYQQNYGISNICYKQNEICSQNQCTYEKCQEQKNNKKQMNDGLDTRLNEQNRHQPEDQNKEITDQNKIPLVDQYRKLSIDQSASLPEEQNRRPSIEQNRRPSVDQNRRPSVDQNRRPSVDQNRRPSVEQTRRQSVEQNRRISIDENKKLQDNLNVRKTEIPNDFSEQMPRRNSEDHNKITDEQNIRTIQYGSFRNEFQNQTNKANFYNTESARGENRNLYRNENQVQIKENQNNSQYQRNDYSFPKNDNQKNLHSNNLSEKDALNSEQNQIKKYNGFPKVDIKETIFEDTRKPGSPCEYNCKAVKGYQNAGYMYTVPSPASSENGNQFVSFCNQSPPTVYCTFSSGPGPITNYISHYSVASSSTETMSVCSNKTGNRKFK